MNDVVYYAKFCYEMVLVKVRSPDANTGLALQSSVECFVEALLDPARVLSLTDRPHIRDLGLEERPSTKRS